MNIGGMGSAYDRTYTPYQANKNTEDFAGYMKNEDGSRVQKTTGEVGKEFSGNFMDDQEFHKFRMSQNGAYKMNFRFETDVDETESTEEDPVEEKEMPEEEETKTEIVVKPDGSKVLMITISIGGQEAVTSVEISKPTKGDLPSKDISGDTEAASSAEAIVEQAAAGKREYGDETIKYAVVNDNPSFGKVMSYEEIMKNWEEQVRVNHAKNAKSLEEVMLETDPDAMQKMYRIVNSPKLYTFYEYIRYMEEQIGKMNENN